MSDENPIGLTELIEQVKRELLSTEIDTPEATPFFSVDEVTLELQVTVSKEGKGGVNIHVVEFGGGVKRDDVQTVKVTLTPLLSKEERVRLYKTRYPELWRSVEEATISGTIKGSTEETPDATFGPWT